MLIPGNDFVFHFKREKFLFIRQILDLGILRLGKGGVGGNLVFKLIRGLGQFCGVEVGFGLEEDGVIF